MNFFLVNPDGSVEAHVTEVVDRILAHGDFGKMQVNRLTRIEWDEERQGWVCYWLGTGEELFTNKSRQEVVRLETEYVESLTWQSQEKV